MLKTRIHQILNIAAGITLSITAIHTANASTRKWELELAVDKEIPYATEILWRIDDLPYLKLGPKPVAKSPVSWSSIQDYMPLPRIIQFSWTTPDGKHHRVDTTIDVEKYTFQSLQFAIGQDHLYVNAIRFTPRGDNSTRILEIPAQLVP